MSIWSIHPCHFIFWFFPQHLAAVTTTMVAVSTSVSPVTVVTSTAAVTKVTIWGKTARHVNVSNITMVCAIDTELRSKSYRMMFVLHKPSNIFFCLEVVHCCKIWSYFLYNESPEQLQILKLKISDTFIDFFFFFFFFFYIYRFP